MIDPLIETQLDEYQLESLLGQGGMARVYRGLDTGLQRYAAIKVIDTPHQQDESYIARFEREARAIAQLDHPHIVTVYRYGRAKNRLYLAMKYIEGADLHAILDGYEQDNQFMPWAEITRLMREMGSALDYAHSRGVIHRDIKPSNVMLDDQGRSYITDFGLALLADVGTRGEILGSPHYIAPEQAVSSAGAVPQSDLYALGVILYRMVTGRLPFTHDDVLELLMLHMTAVPPNPRHVRPDISSTVAEVILKALAKEPDERFANGKALSDALEAAIKDTAVPLAAAPTLSIVDRVALDKEMLPPPPAAVTSQITAAQATTAAPQPAPPTVEQEDRPTLAQRLPFFLKAGGALMVLSLLILAAFFLFRNRENAETPATEAIAIASATAELAAAETAEITSVSLAESTPTATIAETAIIPIPSSLEPTLSPSPGMLYLPVIANAEKQPVSVAVDSAPTSLPSVSPPPSPTETTSLTTETPLPPVYQLLIVAHKEDSLFVVNQSEVPFPLNPLRLGSGKGVIEGKAWELEQLAPGACVTVWKDTGNPKAPNVECSQVGVKVTRKGSERFWKDPFDIFYEGEQVGSCEPPKQCLVAITK